MSLFILVILLLVIFSISFHKEDKIHTTKRNREKEFQKLRDKYKNDKF